MAGRKVGSALAQRFQAIESCRVELRRAYIRRPSVANSLTRAVFIRHRCHASGLSDAYVNTFGQRLSRGWVVMLCSEASVYSDKCVGAQPPGGVDGRRGEDARGNGAGHCIPLVCALSRRKRVSR